MTIAGPPAPSRLVPGAAPTEADRQEPAAARRSVAVLVFTYLLLTAPALTIALTRALDARSAAAAALHGAALLLFAWWSRPGAYPDARWAEFAPLLLVPVLYAELPLLMMGLGATYMDPPIQAVEQFIFGSQPASVLAGAFPWTLLSELLHLAYLSYYPLLYVPAAWVALRGERARLRELVFVLMLVFITFYVIFSVFPVQGPRFLWPAPEGAPDGPVRSLALAILEGGSSRGTAFPSAHMGASVAVTLTLLGWDRRLGAALAVLSGGLGLGAVYGGFHYAVDMIAGAILGAVLVVAARSLLLAAARVR